MTSEANATYHGYSSLEVGAIRVAQLWIGLRLEAEHRQLHERSDLRLKRLEMTDTYAVELVRLRRPHQRTLQWHNGAVVELAGLYDVLHIALDGRHI